MCVCVCMCVWYTEGKYYSRAPQASRRVRVWRMSNHGIDEDKQIVVLKMDSNGGEKTAAEPEKKGRIFWADSANQKLEVHHYSDRLHYSQSNTETPDEDLTNNHMETGNVPPAHTKCCCIIS